MSGLVHALAGVFTPQNNSGWLLDRHHLGRSLGILLAVITGALLLLIAESPMGAVGFVVLLAVFFFTVYRLEWGFYCFIGAVLTIDQFEVPEFDSLTYKINYFNNINIIPYLPRIEPAAFSPMDLHLVLLVSVWLLGFVLRTAETPRRPFVWPLIATFVAWIAFEFLAGAGRGGDSTAALWELRGLVYLVILSLLTAQIIRTKEHIRGVVWVAICAITFKASEGTARFVSLGFSLGGHDAMLTHEDPVFIITLWVLLLGLVMFGARVRQRPVLLATLPILFLGFYAANRRAAFASLAASLLTFCVFLPGKTLLRFLKRSVPVLLVLGLYAGVFWGSNSRFAAPLNQIRSGFADDEQTLGERNYYSNLYRKLENYNLAFTIRSYPLAGIGFGTKYFQPLELVKINYSLRDYMAHNNILWLLVKVGAIGFFLFWLFVNVVGARGAMIAARLRDPYLKAVAVMIIVAVINQLVAAYFDLHLVRYRTMTYLGTLIGLLPALQNIVDAETAEKDSPGPVTGASA